MCDNTGIGAVVGAATGANDINSTTYMPDIEANDNNGSYTEPADTNTNNNSTTDKGGYTPPANTVPDTGSTADEDNNGGVAVEPEDPSINVNGSKKDKSDNGNGQDDGVYEELEDLDYNNGSSITDSISISYSLALGERKLELEVDSVHKIGWDIYPQSDEYSYLIWSSSDNLVAEVDEIGYVRSIRAGKTIITAYTVDRKYSASCEIIVKQKLKFPDTLIQHKQTQEQIVMLKTLIDENEKAYLKGNIRPVRLQNAHTML